MEALPFEEHEHTADLALLVRGSTVGALFENAAQGMLTLLEPDFQDSTPVKESLRLDAIDLETLLVSWLEELLYRIEMDGISFRDCKVEIEGISLQASYTVVLLNSIKKHIKAVTYNELEIVSNQDGFQTLIVFDV